ncbi:hypothetical protein JQ615_40825, partial [Bradyrhizobium jicamae]
DNSGGTLVIDPPADSFNFTHLAAPQAAPAATVQTESNGNPGPHAAAGTLLHGPDFDFSAHPAFDSTHSIATHALVPEGFMLHA